VADAALGEDYKGGEDRDNREEDVATPAVRAGRTKASWILKFVCMLSLCHGSSQYSELVLLMNTHARMSLAWSLFLFSDFFVSYLCYLYSFFDVAHPERERNGNGGQLKGVGVCKGPRCQTMPDGE
jgi:hypothetical protein